MNIGFFTSKYPYPSTEPVKNYSYGGSVLATYYLIEELAKLQNSINVYTSSHNSRDILETQGKLNIFRYGTSLKILSSNLALKLYFKPDIASCDLIHVSFDIPPAPMAAFLAVRKKKIPLVLTYHGDWDPNYGSLFRRFSVKLCNALCTQKILERADIIICPSKKYSEKSLFLRNHAKKIVVIPNGINLTDFDLRLSKIDCRRRLDFPETGNIILFFGNLSPYKGPELLLKAFSKIHKTFPDTYLFFAGQGVEMEKLRRLTTDFALDDSVKFLGYVDEKLKAICYKACDIFCLPSTMMTECYPLSILEAMASGIPVIASDIGGISDIIENGKTGILVEPNNGEHLEHQLSFLLQNPDTRKDLSENALNTIKNYTWEKIGLLTQKAYGEIL